MRYLNKKGFKLPFVEKEKFIQLIRLGLDFKKGEGVYCIKSYNNIEKLIDTIAEILSEDVAFMQNCTLCGKDFPCSECRYLPLCGTSNLPFQCICSNCLKNEKPSEKCVQKTL
jgi:hypothetical protein